MKLKDLSQEREKEGKTQEPQSSTSFAGAVSNKEKSGPKESRQKEIIIVAAFDSTS